MSLPLAWVDRLHSKLAATYGQGFVRQYDGVDPADVKAEWARVLGDFFPSPMALQYGLDNLPADKAPNVLQFRDLCRRAPESAFPKLAALAAPSEPASPEKIAEALSASKAAVKPSGVGSLAWAHALREREKLSGGRGMTMFQKEAWRSALRVDAAEVA